MDLFMMQNVLVIAEAFTMYAKRSLRRLPAKHRLTDIGKILLMLLSLIFMEQCEQGEEKSVFLSTFFDCLSIR